MQVSINHVFERRDDYVAFMDFLIENNDSLRPKAIWKKSDDKLEIGERVYAANLERAKRQYMQEPFPVLVRVHVTTPDDDLGMWIKMKWGC